jgi:hypothetical protein
VKRSPASIAARAASLATALAANWRLKLAALGLTLLLWAVVSAEQVTSQWVPARVEAVIGDPEYVLTGGPDPPTVEVRFTGPGRELWDLALERPTLLLPVENVDERRTFAVEPRMVRLRAGLTATPVDVRPRSVRLQLQQLVTRNVPVQPRIGESSLARYVLADDVEVVPATVRVTGPASEVAALDSLPTERFEIVPDDTTFSREVRLDTLGLQGLSLSRERVIVRGRVDRRVERALPGVAVAAPPGLSAVPDRVEVRLSGPERLVRAVFPATIRVVVPPESVPPQFPATGAEVPLAVQGLPAGVAARTVPERVRLLPPGTATPEPEPPPPAPDDTLPDADPAPPSPPAAESP